MWRALWLSSALMLQPTPTLESGPPPVRNTTPAALQGVGVKEQLGAQLPLQSVVRDHRGQRTTLGELLAHGRPTIVTFNYSDCPMLCSLQLNGLVESLGQMGWRLGEDYDAITLSIDPKESPTRAAETRDRYLASLANTAKKKPTDDAWPFVVADAKTIGAITKRVGFGYRLNPDNGEWLHTASLVLLSPDASVSRYLYGVRYSPQTLRLSLAEASRGERTTTIDQAILYCFQFDPTSGQYTPAIANLMRLGGAATALLVFAAVLRAVRRREEPLLPEARS